MANLNKNKIKPAPQAKIFLYLGEEFFENDF